MRALFSLPCLLLALAGPVGVGCSVALREPMGQPPAAEAAPKAQPLRPVGEPQPVRAAPAAPPQARPSLAPGEAQAALASAVAFWELPAYGPLSLPSRRAGDRIRAVTCPSTDLRELDARALEALGNTEAARRLWQKLVTEGVGGTQAVEAYARLAAAEGRSREALSVVGGLRRKGEPAPEVQAVIGWLHLFVGDPARARPALEATAGTPAAGRYAVFLGRARLATGDLERAAESARLAVAEPGAGAPAWTLLGDVRRAQGLASGAEEAYAKALALAPGDYAASVNLGVLHLGQGKGKEAEALFEAATRAAPKAPEAWNNLGLARKVRGDYPGARQALETALKVDPDFAAALKNLGILIEKYLGQPADAIPYYNRYLNVRKGDADVERWRKAASRLAGEDKK